MNKVAGRQSNRVAPQPEPSSKSPKLQAPRLPIATGIHDKNKYIAPKTGVGTPPANQFDLGPTISADTKRGASEAYMEEKIVANMTPKLLSMGNDLGSLIDSLSPPASEKSSLLIRLLKPNKRLKKMIEPQAKKLAQEGNFKLVAQGAMQGLAEWMQEEKTGNTPKQYSPKDKKRVRQKLAHKAADFVLGENTKTGLPGLWHDVKHTVITYGLKYYFNKIKFLDRDAQPVSPKETDNKKVIPKETEQKGLGALLAEAALQKTGLTDFFNKMGDLSEPQFYSLIDNIISNIDVKMAVSHDFTHDEIDNFDKSLQISYDGLSTQFLNLKDTSGLQGYIAAAIVDNIGPKFAALDASRLVDQMRHCMFGPWLTNQAERPYETRLNAISKMEAIFEASSPPDKEGDSTYHRQTLDGFSGHNLYMRRQLLPNNRLRVQHFVDQVNGTFKEVDIQDGKVVGAGAPLSFQELESQEPKFAKEETITEKVQEAWQEERVKNTQAVATEDAGNMADTESYLGFGKYLKADGIETTFHENKPKYENGSLGTPAHPKHFARVVADIFQKKAENNLTDSQVFELAMEARHHFFEAFMDADETTQNTVRENPDNKNNLALLDQVIGRGTDDPVTRKKAKPDSPDPVKQKPKSTKKKILTDSKLKGISSTSFEDNGLAVFKNKAETLSTWTAWATGADYRTFGDSGVSYHSETIDASNRSAGWPAHPEAVKYFLEQIKSAKTTEEKSRLRERSYNLYKRATKGIDIESRKKIEGSMDVIFFLGEVSPEKKK